MGVSLDFDRITYLAVDLAGQVVAQHSAKGTGNQAPAAVTQRVAEDLMAFLGSAGLARDLVLGIGIAIAGRRGGADREHWLSPQGTAWEHFALEETLGEAIGKPVIVENDSTCAAIGEYWVGRLPSTEDFASVYMTDGFGLGLVIKGDIYRGASSNAGEIGHMTADPGGPRCVCGRRGCLLAMAGVDRIVSLARQDVALSGDLRLKGTPRTIRGDYVKIARAAAAGDDDRAAGLIRQSADYLGSALVSITNLLDLDQIILAGPGLSLVGQIYVDSAAEQLRRDSWVRSVHQVRVGLSSMGNDVAALGAASLVLHTRLTARSIRSRLAAGA